MDLISRRTFLIGTGVGGVAPVTLHAQRATGRVPRIAIAYGVARSPQMEAFIDAGVIQGLRDHGWIPGNSVTVDFVWAAPGTRNERYWQAMRDEVLALKPDLVITLGELAQFLVDEPRTLPVVLYMASDPVVLGLAQSFAKPGKNVTGLASMNDAANAKCIEVLKEVAPGLLQHIAVLWDDTGTTQYNELHLRAAATAAKRLGLLTTPIKLASPDRLRDSFDEIARVRGDALLIIPTNLSWDRRRDIAAEAVRARLPSAAHWPRYATSDVGGLIGFGNDLIKQARQTGRYVDRILRGANPGDLPIEQFGVYELWVNLAVARKLGLNVPRTVLARANEIIE